MTRSYILLLIHFFICIVVLTVLPLVSTISDLPYTFIGLSLCITVVLFGMLLMRYPSERMNPFALLAIIYSLQFSVSLYLVKFHEIVSRNALMRYYNNIDETNLLNALKLSYLFSFIALSIAFIFSRTHLWARILEMVKRALRDEKRLLALFVIGITFIELFLILTGKVTLQGESLIGKDKSNIEVNPIVAIINPIACMAAFLAGYQYASTKNKQLIILLLIQFIWFFLWGRRQIAFFSFLVFIGFYFDKRIVLGGLRIRDLQKVFLAGIFFFFVLTAANFYQQLRTIGGVAVLQNVSVASLKKVFQLYQSSDTDELKHASEYNIELRALSTVAAVAHYDKLLATGGIQRGNGLEIYNNILKATPSNYVVDKSSVLVMESLAAKLTSGKVNANKDLGGTLILEGMIDFGDLGVVLYPIFMTVLIVLFYWVLLKTGSPIVVLWFVITLVYATLSMVEGSIADMFIAMRATILVVLISSVIWVFRKVIRIEKSMMIDERA